MVGRGARDESRGRQNHGSQNHGEGVEGLGIFLPQITRILQE